LSVSGNGFIVEDLCSPITFELPNLPGRATGDEALNISALDLSSGDVQLTMTLPKCEYFDKVSAV
jgi:hypothetical protein